MGTSKLLKNNNYLLNSTRHLEAFLLIGTSIWATCSLAASKLVSPGIILFYGCLIFLSFFTHLYASSAPSQKEGLFFIPNYLYRQGGSAPGLTIAALLPPLVVTGELLTANSAEQKALWAHYLFLTLINGISLLTQCACVNLKSFLSSSFLYFAVVTPLLQFSRFVPIIQNSPLIPFTGLLVFQGLMCAVAFVLRESFTLGELSLVCQGFTFMIFEAVATYRFYEVPSMLPSDFFHQHSPDFILLIGLILGMLLTGFVSVFALNFLSRNTNKYSVALRSAVFYIITGAMILFVVRPLVSTVLAIDPFVWIILFIYENPFTLLLTTYWASAIIFAILLSFSALKNSTLNSRRKYFHGLAMLLFIPGFFIESRFLYIGLAVGLAALFLFEFIRIFEIAPFHSYINGYMISFIDEKDSGIAILGHIYLLLGCSLPIWLSTTGPASSLCGILVLGVGDTAASVIGKRYGKLRWPGSKKTVMGTLGFILSLATSFLLLQHRLFTANFYNALITLFVTILTGLLEAWSSQNDNLVLPLFLYATLQLANPL